MGRWSIGFPVCCGLGVGRLVCPVSGEAWVGRGCRRCGMVVLCIVNESVYVVGHVRWALDVDVRQICREASGVPTFAATAGVADTPFAAIEIAVACGARCVAVRDSQRLSVCTSGSEAPEA